MSLPQDRSITEAVGAGFKPAPTAPTPPVSEPQSEQTDALNALAKTIKGAGMAEPAALLLHIGKPLAWAGGQMLWMLQPFLQSFGVGKRSTITVSGLAKLLEQEDGVDELIEQLRG